MMSKPRIDLLQLTAFLTLTVVSAIALWDINRILLRWIAIILLVGFGLLQSRLPDQDHTNTNKNRANLIILMQVVVIGILIFFSGAGAIFIVLFFILSVNVMMYNSLRSGLFWLVAFSLVTGWQFFAQDGPGAGVRYGLIYAGGFLFFGITTQALTQARLAQRQNSILLEELQAKNRQLEEYAHQVEILAVMEERNRLAREMHDTIGHRLTAAAVQLEGAQRLAGTDAEKSLKMITSSRQQVRDALQDLRQSLGRLREPVEIELSLPQALRRLTDSFQEATGLQISLDMSPGDYTFSPAQRLALYRCAQEGLTNIQRHASATQAWVQFNHANGQAVIQILDNGLGVDTTALNPGFGLRGLKERAAQLGGSVSLASRPEGGSVLSFQIPVKEG